MAFAPPRRTKTLGASTTQKSRLPVASPNKKGVDAQAKTTEDDLRQSATNHGARIIPSRYAQAAAARQAAPSKARTAAKAENIGRVGEIEKSRPGLDFSISSAKPFTIARDSPVKTQHDLAKSIPVSEDEERELLSLRILQTAQTISEGRQSLRQYKLSAESQLEQRWVSVKTLHMDHQLQMVESRMQRDAEELAALSVKDINTLESFISRIDLIQDHSCKVTEAFESWSRQIIAPIAAEWTRANDLLQELCRSTRLMITPLLSLLNQPPEGGVVSTTVQELLALLDAVHTQAELQKILAKATWALECRKISERFEALLTSRAQGLLQERFIWDKV